MLARQPMGLRLELVLAHSEIARHVVATGPRSRQANRRQSRFSPTSEHNMSWTEYRACCHWLILSHDLGKDFGKLAGILGERVSGDVVALEHRDIEIAERPFRLVFEESAVTQAQVRAPARMVG